MPGGQGRDRTGDLPLFIAGRIVAAHGERAALRSSDRDDAEILLQVPQLAYLHPGRFAVIDATQAFPFPAGMRH